MLPLAYMANTLIVEESKLALFGGLTQDESDSKFKVTNEVLYLDLKTAEWQKPSRVFVTNANDMPLTRMGAQMVNYGDKLWVYSGADPYGLGVQLSDFFSFNMKKGLWKKESSYTELKAGEGTLLGQAIRMYNSNAVIFSGGCSIEDQKCEFDQTKSILFDQPNAHFTDNSIPEAGEFSGRMGHSLVQLGESVISFGGCSFGKVCFNDLLI